MAYVNETPSHPGTIDRCWQHREKKGRRADKKDKKGKGAKMKERVDVS